MTEARRSCYQSYIVGLGPIAIQNTLFSDRRYTVMLSVQTAARKPLKRSFKDEAFISSGLFGKDEEQPVNLTTTVAEQLPGRAPKCDINIARSKAISHLRCQSMCAIFVLRTVCGLETG